MNKLKRFFMATPRDLLLQIFTVNEIAERMQPVDINSRQLPWGFACNVSEILRHQSHSRASKLLNQTPNSRD
jgi:hypothetical protein